MKYVKLQAREKYLEIVKTEIFRRNQLLSLSDESFFIELAAGVASKTTRSLKYIVKMSLKSLKETECLLEQISCIVEEKKNTC